MLNLFFSFLFVIIFYYGVSKHNIRMPFRGLTTTIKGGLCYGFAMVKWSLGDQPLSNTSLTLSLSFTIRPKFLCKSIAASPHRPRPQTSCRPACPCTREYKPWCGSNGRSYANACILNCARRSCPKEMRGVTVKRQRGRKCWYVDSMEMETQAVNVKSFLFFVASW